MTLLHNTMMHGALISSVFEVCVTQPIDVIKTNYQNSTKTIISFKNLYKGFLPRAIGNIPSRTIFLYSQDFFTTGILFSPYKDYKNIAVPILAGFSQTLVDTPVEVLKINKITSQNERFLFKGFLPHCSRNIIFLGFVYNFREHYKSDSILKNAFYGGIGGVFGSYISHPLDTIKTRIQSNKSFEITFRELMKGCHLRASMGMINMFISLGVYELINTYKLLDMILPNL
jgi:hypothetical protein